MSRILRLTGSVVFAALCAAAFAVASTGCIDMPIGGGGGGGDTTNVGSGSNAGIPIADGFVTSPLNGQLFTGQTSTTVIPVAGTYNGTSGNLNIQIADPTNNNQWTTVGAASVQSGAFATEVGPFNQAQFPQGGVLALRVIDDTGGGLPYQFNNDQQSSNVALVVGSPGQNPEDWTFLTQQPLGSQQTTAEYYNVIGAPKTLTDFETEFFPQGSTPAAPRRRSTTTRATSRSAARSRATRRRPVASRARSKRSVRSMATRTWPSPMSSRSRRARTSRRSRPSR